MLLLKLEFSLASVSTESSLCTQLGARRGTGRKAKKEPGPVGSRECRSAMPASATSQNACKGPHLPKTLGVAEEGHASHS